MKVVQIGIGILAGIMAVICIYGLSTANYPKWKYSWVSNPNVKGVEVFEKGYAVGDTVFLGNKLVRLEVLISK
jgi:hypothetical protein